jgi:hypothetical protein
LNNVRKRADYLGQLVDKRLFRRVVLIERCAAAATMSSTESC